MPVFLIIWQYTFFLPKTNNLELKNYQAEIIGYLSNKNKLPQEMTDLEFSHMTDVKGVIDYTNLFTLFSLLLILLFYFILKIRNKLKLFYQSLKIASLSVLFLTIFLLISVVFNFDYLFIIFHEIFFPQGNWLFPASSQMIQAFPELLFQKLAFYSFGISAMLALLIIIYLSFKKNV